MNLNHPEVVKIISEAQTQIRHLIGDESILLIPLKNNEGLIEFDQLCNIICSATGVSYVKAIKKNRCLKERRTRQLIAYYAYRHCKMTFKHIGEVLGGRHHTTMMSSVNVIQDLIDSNEKEVCSYVQKVNELLASE